MTTRAIGVALAAALLTLGACSALTSETAITGEIDVEILGRQGQPIPDARVILYTGNRHVQYLRTDAQGRGTFTLVPRATYGVFVPLEDGVFGLGRVNGGGDEGNIQAPISINGGDRGSASFTLMKFGFGTYEAVVRDSTGTPVAGIPVTVYSDVADYETRVTDASGVALLSAPFGPVGARVTVPDPNNPGDSITILRQGLFMDAGHFVSREFIIPVQ